jgi:energy-coupling factor transporter ATP-binding protein EcfA2
VAPLDLVEIKDLTYFYPQTSRPALEDINLSVSAGQFVLVVGGSGSGKTSLLRAVAGLIPAFYGGTVAGRVYLQGEDIRNIPRRRLVQQVGIVFQDPESQLVMNTLEGELAFGLENLGLDPALTRRRIVETAAALNLGPYLSRPVAQLSGGLKQKAILGSVLAMQPRVLLLDEPTSQLDPMAGEEILAAIRRLNEENGITVILVEQRLERCFHLADRVVIMDRGRIVCDAARPGEAARWAVRTASPFVPPLARLFAGEGWREVPLTVKEGLRLLNREMSRAGDKLPPGEGPLAKKSALAGGTPLVKVKDLWFTYPNGQEALRGIDLTVKAGDFTIIMGENAAGKTTLLKVLRGLLKPGRGLVRVLGRDIARTPVEELAGEIGYLSQNPDDHFFLPTVEEELNYTRKKLGLPVPFDAGEMLAQLGLAGVAGKNPRDLSQGERQRVALAVVMAASPRVLLLDEPTRGLDYQAKRDLGELLRRLREQGQAIVVVTHDVEFAAEYGEEIVLLSAGRVVARGEKHEVLTGGVFYSPQVSRLFQDTPYRVVTLEEGRQILRRLRQGRDSKLRREEIL